MWKISFAIPVALWFFSWIYISEEKKERKEKKTNSPCTGSADTKVKNKENKKYNAVSIKQKNESSGAMFANSLLKPNESIFSLDWKGKKKSEPWSLITWQQLHKEICRSWSSWGWRICCPLCFTKRTLFLAQILATLCCNWVVHSICSPPVARAGVTDYF